MVLIERDDEYEYAVEMMETKLVKVTWLVYT